LRRKSEQRPVGRIMNAGVEDFAKNPAHLPGRHQFEGAQNDLARQFRLAAVMGSSWNLFQIAR
jgi:hypothetical protein